MRHVLLALTAVLDEILSLARWLQDHAFVWLTCKQKPLALLVDASRAGRRMCRLIRNLVGQIEGIQRVKPAGFKADSIPLWSALAIGLQPLACMDALRPSLNLVMECTAQDFPPVSAQTRTMGAKVLAKLADTATCPDDALGAVCLYVLLHRLGHTQGAFFS